MLYVMTPTCMKTLAISLARTYPFTLSLLTVLRKSNSPCSHSTWTVYVDIYLVYLELLTWTLTPRSHGPNCRGRRGGLRMAGGL